MEVSILSRESVKPSSTLLLQTKPLNLNLLDQLTPTGYSPLILFYPKHNTSNVSIRLKSSLSEALSLYYPLVGRVRDNFAIHDFHKGVPFVETRVSCHMYDFLGDQSSLLGSLNNLLPFKTFCMAPETCPQIAVQVNMFQCGGLALGMCFSHKSHDGTAVSAFLKTWAAINANRLDEIVVPNFLEGPLTFPPIKSMPDHYESLTKELWFESGGKPVTRRFVFFGDSVAKLRASAKSKNIENPTRAEAVSAFIWKSIIHASKSRNRCSVFTQSVDLRRMTRPRLSRLSFGNLILFSNAKYDPHKTSQPIRIDDLASLIRNGVKEFDIEYLKLLTGEKGSKAIFEYYDRQAEIEDENMDVFNFSCWHGLGFSKTDFGWGPTAWVGLSGATRDQSTMSYCSNSIILIERGSDKEGMEAWLTLEENVMTELELDHDFLLFASPNSTILTPLYDMHAKL
ncbi:Stemmadenine O-acetyltransferase [Linum perenne]